MPEVTLEQDVFWLHNAKSLIKTIQINKRIKIKLNKIVKKKKKILHTEMD